MFPRATGCGRRQMFQEKQVFVETVLCNFPRTFLFNWATPNFSCVKTRRFLTRYEQIKNLDGKVGSNSRDSCASWRFIFRWGAIGRSDFHGELTQMNRFKS
jgi:hypothetical protein